MSSTYTTCTRFCFTVLIAAFACACSTDTEPGPGDDDDDDDDIVGAADAAPAPVDAAEPAPDAEVLASCTGLDSPPVDSVRTLSTADGERSYRLHVPSSYDPTVRTPVVFNFHGLTMNALSQEWYSGMLSTSDAEGFIVVHPEGIGNSWNSGACCGDAASQNVDDVGFVGAILDELEAELCVDSNRVYSTGMSNGGHMSNQVACALSHRFAAIAPVAGTNYSDSCDISRPVPVLHFHGTSDTIVPYDYGTTAVDGWLVRNGCSGDPETTFTNGEVQCDTWNDCDGDVEVTLCTVTGGGHTWPGAASIPGLGHVTDDISANDAMWTFFQRYRLP